MYQAVRSHLRAMHEETSPVALCDHFCDQTGGKGKERTGKDRTNRTLQTLECCSLNWGNRWNSELSKNGHFSLLISGP